MSAALCMPALDDCEDDPPHYRLQAMPDNEDSRESVTLTPDTDRAARDTTPPDPLEEKAAVDAMRRSALLPPRAPATLEDSYLDKAIRVVAEAGADIRIDREERRLQHAAVLEAIRRSDANQTRNYELLRDEVRHLKESDRHQDRRLAEGDERFAQIENSIEVLKNELLAAVAEANKDAARRIGALERELRELKDNAARAAQAAANAPTQP